jgi:hypothetical protein
MNDNKDFRLRDLLALPFHAIGYFFIMWGTIIGGKWTARKMLQIFSQPFRER